VDVQERGLRLRNIYHAEGVCRYVVSGSPSAIFTPRSGFFPSLLLRTGGGLQSRWVSSEWWRKLRDKLDGYTRRSRP
jgi:hypothetical protein